MSETDNPLSHIIMFIIIITELLIYMKVIELMSTPIRQTSKHTAGCRNRASPIARRIRAI